MFNRSYISLLACFILWFNTVQAQEEQFLDDSTKEVHGLHTTFFITPWDVKFNRSGLRPIIPTIHKIDQFTHRQQLCNKIQDLGNQGTAVTNIFYTLPRHIGFHTGFQAYDIYFNNPLHQPYYDTKSPYTDGTVIFANYGSYIFTVTHARSINKHWHAGITFESMLTDREFIPSKIPYDRQVITYPFTTFVRYISKDERYQAMASFYRKNHRNRETGGIASDSTTVLSPMILKDWLKPKAEIRNNLTSKDHVENSELRQQYYLYHQVNVVDLLQIYHETILTNTFNRFEIGDIAGKSVKFLSGEEKPKDATKGKKVKNKEKAKDKKPQTSMADSTVTKNWSNEWGIKGSNQHFFYQYYYRNQMIDFQKIRSDRFKRRREDYLGGNVRLMVWDNLECFHFHGEYLRGDYYKLRTAYEGQWVEIGYDQIKHQPFQIAQYYDGLYRKWEKTFNPSYVKQIEGALKLPIPYLFIRPYGKISHIQSPIYFKKLPQAEIISTAIQPLQSANDVQVRTLGAQINISISSFHIDTDVMNTSVQGPATNVFSVPEWYTNIRTYYAEGYHEGNAGIETGIEVNWKSDYYGDAYDPVTQQFFKQRNFIIYFYPVFELFFNFRIKTFRGFLKAIHLNQGTPKEGYFVTPFYPGQLRSIDLGVSWSLFD